METIKTDKNMIECVVNHNCSIYVSKSIGDKDWATITYYIRSYSNIVAVVNIELHRDMAIRNSITIVRLKYDKELGIKTTSKHIYKCIKEILFLNRHLINGLEIEHIMNKVKSKKSWYMTYPYDDIDLYIANKWPKDCLVDYGYDLEDNCDNMYIGLLYDISQDNKGKNRFLFNLVSVEFGLEELEGLLDNYCLR